MSGFRKLVEISDKACREELGNYYVVSENRMNNMIDCLEQGAAKIQNLRAEYDAYREAALVEADLLRKQVATRCIEHIQNNQMTRSAVVMKIKKEFNLET